MISSRYQEELLFSIASLSPPLLLKSGTIEIPNNFSDPTTSEIIPTTYPILRKFHLSLLLKHVYTQPLSSTLTFRHSPTPPHTNLQVTIDNYTIP